MTPPSSQERVLKGILEAHLAQGKGAEMSRRHQYPPGPPGFWILHAFLLLAEGWGDTEMPLLQTT